MSSTPRIKTTVVGSYPVPDWLAALPSEQALLDATRVVIDTQEQAGIDVVCDGELYRFDVNHPETNGMIEYFVRPLDGVRTRMSFEELFAFRSKHAVGFRMRPPGVVEGPIGAGTLALPDACARAKALASHPFKFTLTGPHMLAKTLVDRHYKSTAELAHGARRRARGAGAAPRRRRRPGRRGEPARARPTNGTGPRPRSTACSTRCRRPPRCIYASATTAASRRRSGTWAKLMSYLNALARRPRRAGVRASAGRGAGGVQGRSDPTSAWVSASWTSSAPRSNQADQIARAIEAAERTIGAGPREVHPSRLRFLDAQALDRGRKDPGARRGPRPLRRPDAPQDALTSRTAATEPGTISRIVGQCRLRMRNEALVNAVGDRYTATHDPPRPGPENVLARYLPRRPRPRPASACWSRSFAARRARRLSLRAAVPRLAQASHRSRFARTNAVSSNSG